MRVWFVLMSVATVLVIGVTGWVTSGSPTTRPGVTTNTTTSTSRSSTLTEDQKIDLLIRAVSELQDAVFIRNKSEHDCASAAKHMRDKWEWKRKEIRTARDFIRVAASKSSTSGEPYLIKFKTGKTSPSGEYLMSVLDKLERPTSSQATSSPAHGP